VIASSPRRTGGAVGVKFRKRVSLAAGRGKRGGPELMESSGTLRLVSIGPAKAGA